MRSPLCLALCLCLFTASAVEYEVPKVVDDAVLLEMASKAQSDPLAPNGGRDPAGYTITEGFYDNPSTNLDATPLLASAPDCTVRPETVIEIQKLRASSKAIADAMQAEIENMGRRKAYIEQMTSYINDRIRDLNKVKAELKQEGRWMDASNNKIQELAEKEHLVKYEDVLACLNTESTALSGASAAKKAIIASLNAKAAKMNANILAIQTDIKNVKDGKTGGEAAAPA